MNICLDLLTCLQKSVLLIPFCIWDFPYGITSTWSSSLRIILNKNQLVLNCAILFSFSLDMLFFSPLLERSFYHIFHCRLAIIFPQCFKDIIHCLLVFIIVVEKSLNQAICGKSWLSRCFTGLLFGFDVFQFHYDLYLDKNFFFIYPGLGFLGLPKSEDKCVFLVCFFKFWKVLAIISWTIASSTFSLLFPYETPIRHMLELLCLQCLFIPFSPYFYDKRASPLQSGCITKNQLLAKYDWKYKASEKDLKVPNIFLSQCKSLIFSQT